MIKSLQDLRDKVNSIIKVIPNNSPEKTQAADVKQYLLDNIDSIEDLVNQLGLSISSNLTNVISQVNTNINTQVNNAKPDLSSYAKSSQLPDLSIYQKLSDVIPYTRLSGTPSIPVLPDLTPYAKKPDIPTYDFSTYQKIGDTIAFSRLTGVPNAFDGTWNSLTGKPTFFDGNYNSLINKPIIPSAFSGSYLDLTNKPTLFDGSWNSLSNKPTLVTSYNQLSGLPLLFDGKYSSLSGLPTLFNGDYNSLLNKPTIPTYDLSLYRLKTDSIDYSTLINKPALFNGDYTSLINKPTIITDYSQLANKPKVSTLVWNQLSNLMVTNTTSEVNSLLAVNGNGSLTIPANIAIGTAFRLTGRGLFSLQTLTSPQLTIKLYLGNTVIALGSSSSLLLGASNKSFSFGADILVTATNTVYTQGFFAYYAGATDALSSTPLVTSTGGVSATTIDLTVANDLKLTFTWSVASTSNQIAVKVVNFERLSN